jgi:dihydropteroate synthase
MEADGADCVDIGGMSTAPYLSTTVSERQETTRVLDAVKQVQKASNLPISVDTCRAGVAKAALEEGVEILNDISGLKYDSQMMRVVERYEPSLVLCAYSATPLRGDLILQTKLLLKQSIRMALSAKINKENIVLDPAIGFFRKRGKNPFFTKISGSWLAHDLQVLQNISDLKMDYPILISASNKSFIGNILESKDPADRLFGSLTAEAIAAMNGADIVRTHNVRETKSVISLAQKLSRKIGKGL